KDEKVFLHYSTSENVDTGMWGLTNAGLENETLSDQIEKAIVNYLQKNPTAIFLEVEEDLYRQFTGLMTPSKGMIYAVLKSYATNEDKPRWKLRDEDISSVRREEVKNIFNALEEIGKRLNYD